MNLGLDFLWPENLFDYTLFVHEISRANDSYGLVTAGKLLAPASKSLQKFSRSVGNQREFESVCLGEFGLGFLLVFAYSDNLVPSCFKFSLVSLKRAGLGGSSACVGLGI